MRIINSLNIRTYSVKSLSYLFVSSHAVLLIMMTYTFPRINEQIGGPAFDLRPSGYSASEARSILGNLNDQTIDLYLFPQLTLLDIMYPFLLALFLSSFLFRLLRLTKKKSKTSSILVLVPFIAMIFDYLENTCIILMITESVEITESFVQTSSTFSILKGVFTSFAWISILLYSIKYARMRVLERKNKTSV
ncbi:MAG: hypothetical protein HRT58_20545 [Crocinitomicaceae bacterium]|nr:hypothetical protein [Flavobacteriales bacterium]NQZ38061.1 hypothetical protein [Crocinitomicaceae bacterium]